MLIEHPQQWTPQSMPPFWNPPFCPMDGRRRHLPRCLSQSIPLLSDALETNRTTLSVFYLSILIFGMSSSRVRFIYIFFVSTITSHHYVSFRNGGTKATTRIKRVSGDRDAFLSELRSVLNLPAPANGNPRDDAIRIRTGGTIEVNGNRVREVKEWLAGLGF